MNVKRGSLKQSILDRTHTTVATIHVRTELRLDAVASICLIHHEDLHGVRMEDATLGGLVRNPTVCQCNEEFI